MRVVLLKNKTVPDGYESIFTATGIEPVFVPLLKHEFVDRPGLVRFLDQDQSDSLIITSQRAVEATAYALKHMTAPHTILAKPVYSVGPATSKALADLGFQDVRGGSNAGNGHALAKIIIDDTAGAHCTLLFLTGKVRKDIIPNALNANESTTLVEKVVYQTEDLADIDQRYASAVDGQELLWVAIFSPSGLSPIIDQLKSQHQQGKIKIASIGPTTQQWLVEHGLTADATALKPDPTSLLECITQSGGTHSAITS